MSRSKRQHKLDVLETKMERPGSDGLDICRGGIAAILSEGGKEEQGADFSWM